MLIRPVDACLADDEWRGLLAASEMGQLIVPVADDLPVVVPTHYVYDGATTVELHLAVPNPVWPAVGDGTDALFTVTGPFVYIPSHWNANPGTPTEYGVPTSYYAAIVARVRATPVDDPADKAALLRRQIVRFQPEGGHAPIEPGDNPYGKMLAAIRGLRLEVRDVRAKFKFGGNKSPEHQRMIADHLARRDRSGDAAARQHQLRRLG
jgi:transcriptional regulator